MAASAHIKNVVIVGASGHVGRQALKHLLASKRFTITVLTRVDTTASFPPDVTVKKGAYADPDFLHSTFSGNDAAVFALSFMATNDQSLLITAAAKAGVRWILPNEYAGDGLNPAMADAVPVFQPKREAREEIESLSLTHQGLRWIGVCTGPWLEFSLSKPVMFGIDFKAKKATTWEKGGRFNCSTLPRIGEAIATLLSLPIENPENPRASLHHYANNFLYVSSFHITQDDLIASVQRITATQPEEWQVEKVNGARLDIGLQKAAQGVPVFQNADLLFGTYMQEGAGGDVEAKAKEDRQVLGLTEEDLDEWVKRVVRGD